MSEEKQVHTATEPKKDTRQQQSQDSRGPRRDGDRNRGSRRFGSRRNDRNGERGERRAGDRGGRNNDKNFGGRDGGRGRFGRRGDKRERKPREDQFADFESEVIQIRRITRVVKGGKRMRFSALVVVGDKKGKVGFGLEKGLDFQDAVAKATRQAKKNIIRLNITDAKSIAFPIDLKYKSSKIMLKPADTGTGLIAGGFVRPILTLAGFENIYSKIIGSANKVVGVQSVFQALEKFVK